MQGVSDMLGSLSHAPGFTNFAQNSGGTNSKSQNLVNNSPHVEEFRKTVEMGEKVGIDLSKYGQRIANLVEGQGECTGVI